MKIVGGYYREICEIPRSIEDFGSGGRAAMILGSYNSGVEFHTYCPPSDRPSAAATFAAGDVTPHFYDTDELVTFRYLHPLASPTVTPWPVRENCPIYLEGDVILRFGMMEGDAVISAGTAVYDPQAPGKPELFSKNGSKADRLALVLNTHELEAFVGKHTDELTAISALIALERPNVVVVKGGAEGARVYEDGKLKGRVPAFRTSKVYKVGSGDAFSAAFANYWAIRSLDPLVAADYASRTAARYCETRSPTLWHEDNLRQLTAVSKNREGLIYLAGPFFTTGDLWLVEEIRRALWTLGTQVFSPYHLVGAGDNRTVAEADLKGLCQSTAVLAIVSGGDHGTLFEVGYAVNAGIPVVALYENPKPSDFTMLSGSGCEVTSDLSTAVYKAAWASWA